MSKLRQQLVDGATSDDDRESRLFWLIIELIECGHLEEAEALVRKFNPEDSRLLLGVFLGCFLLERLKVSTKEQRKVAERIRIRLEEHTRALRNMLRDEVKSELLELQQGELRALPENAEGLQQRE